MRKKLKGLLKLSLVVLLALASGWILSAGTSTTTQSDNISRILRHVEDVLHCVEENYYDKDNIDYQKIEDYMIEGILRGLDKFSHYISPSMLEEEEIEMTGEYGGLGIEVTWDKDLLAVEIIAPMYGTPAWAAGLKTGDKIIEIDGQPTSEMTFLEAVKKLRGKPGTEVKIKVIREGVKEPLEFTIVRAKIVIIPVKYAKIDTAKGPLGYVKITKFMSNVQEKLADVLRKLKNEYGIKGLILDLRDNPGGYLVEAIGTSAIFLKKGKIVRIRSSDGDEEIYGVDGDQIKRIGFLGLSVPIGRKLYDYSDDPVFVLVNKGSASASEIVSGALKDNSRAVLIGTKTFGKGSVQTGFELENGGILYLTTAHYLTPSGKDINGVGITPDYIISEKEKTPEHKEEVIEYTKEVIKVDPSDPYIKKAIELFLKEM